MLKPIEVLNEIDKAAGLPEEERQRRREKLLDVLLNPLRPDSNEAVHSVFAHGAEAMRVVTVPDSADHHPHWAVQAWSLGQERWVTQKSYPMHHDPSDVHKDAALWYPPLSWADALNKWSAVARAADSDLGAVFDSRARLAEFWYETTTAGFGPGGLSIDRYEDSPWPFVADIAHTVFVSFGTPDPIHGVAYGARLSNQLTQLAISWGEEVRISPADAKTPDVETYNVSVSYERWFSDDDREFGQPQERGVLVDQAQVTGVELKALAAAHHIAAASASSPGQSPYIWFYSTEPVPGGVESEPLLQQFYSLHIHRADGREPEPADYQTIADQIGVRFDHPLRLEEQQTEAEFALNH